MPGAGDGYWHLWNHSTYNANQAARTNSTKHQPQWAHEDRSETPYLEKDRPALIIFSPSFGYLEESYYICKYNEKYFN
jgi:hypothetical protein